MAVVLLVEPDKVLGDVYEQALQAAGHTAVVKVTAQAAIHQIDKKRPDIIIVELQLTEHNGVEFLYELRSYPDWQAIPVIINSSVPPQEVALSSEITEKLNIVSYCYKPSTTLQQLISIVSKTLQS